MPISAAYPVKFRLNKRRVGLMAQSIRYDGQFWGEAGMWNCSLLEFVCSYLQ